LKSEKLFVDGHMYVWMGGQTLRLALLGRLRGVYLKIGHIRDG